MYQECKKCAPPNLFYGKKVYDPTLLRYSSILVNYSLCKAQRKLTIGLLAFAYKS